MFAETGFGGPIVQSRASIFIVKFSVPKQFTFAMKKNELTRSITRTDLCFFLLFRYYVCQFK